MDNIGKRVYKVSGYGYPGEIVAEFKTKAGKVRYVVEATGAGYEGMLHIFSPEQIEIEPSGGEYVAAKPIPHVQVYGRATRPGWAKEPKVEAMEKATAALEEFGKTMLSIIKRYS